jgi:hypothetical protein
VSEPRRLKRERKTVRVMIGMYCADHHDGDGLCSECAKLADYADRKLDICPYGPEKPTCTACPIHCYRSEPREKMRLIMRYAGPRMPKTHPVLALFHIFDAKREPPPPLKKPRSR